MDTRTSCKSPWGAVTGGPVLTKLALQGLEWNWIQTQEGSREGGQVSSHLLFPQLCGPWWGLGGVSQDGGGPPELSVAFHTPTIGGAGEQATRVRTGVPGSLLLSAQTQA